MMPYKCRKWGQRNGSRVASITTIAVQGVMGWVPPQVKIWKSMGKCWARFKDIDNNRPNKTTFDWCIKHGENRCRNWCLKFRNHISLLGIEFLLNDNVAYSKKYIAEKIYEHEFEIYKRNWSTELNNQERAYGSYSKLRSYRLFKSEYKT